MNAVKISSADRTRMLNWFNTITYNACNGTPEGRLAQAVLAQAVADSVAYVVNKPVFAKRAHLSPSQAARKAELAIDAGTADNFLKPSTLLFGIYCDTASLDRDWVYEKAMKQLEMARYLTKQ